jgi:hypothetical protein
MYLELVLLATGEALGAVVFVLETAGLEPEGANFLAAATALATNSSFSSLTTSQTVFLALAAALADFTNAGLK